ncbi:DUF4153 domain-containing protein [Streptomyces sp. NPDC001780]
MTGRPTEPAPGPEPEPAQERKPDPGPGPEPEQRPECGTGSQARPEPGPEPSSGPSPGGTPPARPNPTAAPDWRQWQPAPPGPPAWAVTVRAAAPARIRPATLWSVLATALLGALILTDGAGLNLLIVAAPAALAACFAARAAGRRPRPWTLVWAVGGPALLTVPALRDGGLPTFLAVVSALALGALALHGSRTWAGLVFAPLGLIGAVGPGVAWGWHGLRARMEGSRGRWMPVLRTVAVAAVLLIVFGALFSAADAAFADLLGALTPVVPVVEGPWRFLMFAVGLGGALAAARTAAAPLRWDRLALAPGRARGRVEWALPLIVLNLLFAAFIAVQLAVLLGGYDEVLARTGLSRAEYARQGFWQLLWVTFLVLVVIALAGRWAPRGGARDRTLVRTVLGVLCALALVVVASALRRMDLYVDAYGLTRLRISVAAVELWLGVVIVLVMVAGAVGGRWLPRAVAASAAASVLAYGLLSPDALVAERNVRLYEQQRKIDVGYFQQLSADAVPALDRLPEPLRSCALHGIERNLGGEDEPWYATSWSEHRAREILALRKPDATASCADRGGSMPYEGEPGPAD